MLDFSAKKKNAVYKPLISENQSPTSRSSTWTLFGLMVFLGAAFVLSLSLHEGTSRKVEISIGALEAVDSGNTFDLNDGKVNKKNQEKFSELCEKLDPFLINEKPKTLVPKDAKTKEDKKWRIDLQGITDKYANIQYQVGDNTLGAVLVHVDVLSEENMKQKDFPEQVKEAIEDGLMKSMQSAAKDPKKAKTFKIDPEGGSSQNRKAEDEAKTSPGKDKKRKKEGSKAEDNASKKKEENQTDSEKKKKKTKRQGIKSPEK